MRKIAEKVALVAQICVAIVFVIVAMLYAFGVIPQIELQNNAVVVVVMIVLAVIFVGTSVYLLYMNFSELQNIKRVLLYADSKCATTTTLKVVNKIARNCADKVDGVHVKRTKIRADEKKGYVATFTVQVSATSVTPALEQLRRLIEDSFEDTLGLVFNTITFEVVKLTSQPTADVTNDKHAQVVTESADENSTDETACDTVATLTDEQQNDVPTDATETETETTDVAEETTDKKEPANV